MDQSDKFVSQDDIHCDKLFPKEVIEYQNQVENILAWLYRKKEELGMRPDGSVLEDCSYNQILEEYSVHEKFMTEFCEFCHVIVKCKEEGQEMRDNLSDENSDEIGIQMDAMLVHYENLKILTADRLRSLQSIIEKRQQSKIERFEEWLSAVEKKIISSTNIGPDYSAIQKQMRDLDDLKIDLEQKQDFLNFMSKMIIFDEVDPESLRFKSRSSESINDRLETINNRWKKICTYVEERNLRLKSADSIWKLLNIEGPQFATWLSKVEASLTEVSDAAKYIPEEQIEKALVAKLVSRSEKIDSEIKNKQSFYTRLESEVRSEIEKLEIDDSCSMLVIELEKKLEELQENWNAVLNRKRFLDYDLAKPRLSNHCNIIPIPDSITSRSRDELHSIGQESPRELPTNHELGDQFNNSFSSNNEDGDSSLHINGISNSLSDPRGFDNSLSSDTKSMAYGNNHDQQPFNGEFESRDEISSASITASYPINMVSPTDDSSYSPLAITMNQKKSVDAHISSILPNSQSDSFSDQPEHNHTSCRVEEWEHSLESFSTWLKRVEFSLGIDDSRDYIVDKSNPQRIVPWSQLDLIQQITLLNDIENKINSSCQDEFDCLFLQGQQIFEDLIPEIGENESEANLKKILDDVDIRYSAVKRFLDLRRHELTNKDRWRELLRKLRSSCDYLINQMKQVVPESNIGVDLITIAQQQDQLIHTKADLQDNLMIQSNIREAELFLMLCEEFQQQNAQCDPNNDVGRLANNHFPTRKNSVDIWMSFKDLKEDVERQLDRLRLHHSELSQLIEDRLARLDEVHKEMHAIQHHMQELATKLQVAEILKSNWLSLENLDVEKLSEQLEDLKLYRERLSEVESTHKMMNLVFESMTQANVPLSQQNLKRISELNTIWTLIQTSVEERQKQIEQAFDNQCSSEQEFLKETVADLPRWERRVAPTKIPYFIDHGSNKLIWDHPRFTELLNDLTIAKSCVFSAYRTALKLKIVQSKLGIGMLMLEKLKEVFESTELRIKQEVQANDPLATTQKLSNGVGVVLIGVEHLIMYLKAIYERIQTEESPSLNVPLSIDLTLNWLLNLYDSTRTGYISNLSLKIGLALICCATREEKYIFIYELISNPVTGLVDARQLGTLAEICMRIPKYLGEGDSFGGPEIVESSVRDCFSKSKYNPERPNCIDMSDFINWLKTEPQFIIWLPVLHRLLISEHTTHQLKCKLCGTKPIVGLRYRCLRCLNYNICQHCFLNGVHIFEHHDPATHTMQEYCSKTSSGENVRDLTKILRNKLILKSKSGSHSMRENP